MSGRCKADVMQYHSHCKEQNHILYSEEKEKLNYAMGMIATAAALERPTELFFSGKSVLSLINNNQISSLSYKNSAELLVAITDLNTQLTVCSGSLSDNNITENELRNDIDIKITGLASILSSENQDSQIIFI